MGLVTLLIGTSEFAQETALVEGVAFRHCFRALRMKVGDRLRAVDGFGHARSAVVVEVARQQARIELGGAVEGNEPAIAVDLWVALPRPERAGWLVEKATELGARRIFFFESQRTVRTAPGNLVQRLGRIARSALEQSGGSWLPEIGAARPWSDLLASLDAADLPAVPRADRPERASSATTAPRGGPPAGGAVGAWLLDPTGLPAATEFRLLSTLRASGCAVERVLLIVGPEGGLTEEETTEVARAGVRQVSLGVRILRVETAAVVGLGAVLSAASG